MATAKKASPKPAGPHMDAVLTRMLNTPPTTHLRPKPVKKTKPKKGGVYK